MSAAWRPPGTGSLGLGPASPAAPRRGFMKQHLRAPVLGCGLVIGIVAGCSSSTPADLGDAAVTIHGGGGQGSGAAPGPEASAPGGSGGMAARPVDGAAGEAR